MLIKNNPVYQRLNENGERIVGIELKSVRRIIKEFEAQLVNYLTATAKPVGGLLNFGESKVGEKNIRKQLKQKSCQSCSSCQKKKMINRIRAYLLIEPFWFWLGQVRIYRVSQRKKLTALTDKEIGVEFGIGCSGAIWVVQNGGRLMAENKGVKNGKRTY